MERWFALTGFLVGAGSRLVVGPAYPAAWLSVAAALAVVFGLSSWFALRLVNVPVDSAVARSVATLIAAGRAERLSASRRRLLFVAAGATCVCLLPIGLIGGFSFVHLIQRWT